MTGVLAMTAQNKFFLSSEDKYKVLGYWFSFSYADFYFKLSIRKS